MKKGLITISVLLAPLLVWAAATRVITADQIKSSDKTKTFSFPSATATLVGAASTQTLTNKTIDADQNTVSNIENADIKAAAAIAVNKLAAVTASRVLVSDGSGFVSPSSVTTTTLGYVDFTSSGQTQLDAKQARSTLTTKGDMYVATASATVARQGVGSDGQVLTADSGQTNGIKWATPASAPSSSDEISNTALATSVASNALTIALKESSGSDCSSGSPCKIGFRNATSATGTYNQRSVTAALSVVVSSGSTLGLASGVNEYIYVYLIDNSGTVELAVSGSLFDTGSILSTTAEGGAGAADSRTAIYSTTARSNVPVRLIGRLRSNQTTSGTYASNVNEISLSPFSLTADGTYSATISNGANSASITSPSTCSYTRVGNSTQVACFVTSGCTTGGGTDTALRITLPVASNLTAVADLVGTLGSLNATAEGGRVYADTTNKVAYAEYKCQSTGATGRTVWFQYIVK